MIRQSTLPRVVLDTNVVVSALVFTGGPAAALRKAWQAPSLVPVVSKATVSELLRVLAYPKFRLTRHEQDDLLADYVPWCQTCVVPESVPRIPACRDPHDRIFLALAATAKVDYLVSGDRDILSLRKDFAVAIVSLEEFLGSLGR